MFSSSEILIARHADADAPHGYLDGPGDPSLTTLGEWQAEDLGRFVRKLGVELVVTSPHLRAVTTAEIVAAQNGLEVVKEEELRELDWGPYAGWKQRDVFTDKVSARLEAEGLDGRICSGVETYHEVAARVAEVIGRYQKERALLVGHGAAWKSLIGVELGWSRTQTRKYPIGNAELLGFNLGTDQEPRRLFFPEVA